MSVSLSSLNVSNGMIYRNNSAARAEAEAANGRSYKLEFEITEKSILTDKDDFTPGRWRVLDNGVKVFNSILADNFKTPGTPGYERLQRGLKMSLNAAPVVAQKETSFEYTPMKNGFSWSRTYLGMVSRADNPEATPLERIKEDMHQELKAKVEEILENSGNPPKNELRFGINQDTPYFYESVKTGNGKENMQNATGEIATLIKDFFDRCHLLNKGANINL
jgi:hypothetical protein